MKIKADTGTIFITFEKHQFIHKVTRSQREEAKIKKLYLGYCPQSVMPSLTCSPRPQGEEQVLL